MKKDYLIKIVIIVKIFILPVSSIAQVDSNSLCKPKEGTKSKFQELTDKILSLPSIDKNIKQLSSEGNCLIFLTNDIEANYLQGIIFYLDSSNNISKGFFMKLNPAETNMPYLSPFKKKQLREFKTLRNDTSLNQFLFCHTNSLHEKWEIVILLNRQRLNGGLYFIGGLPASVSQKERNQGLVAYREKIRHIRQ